MSTTVNYSDGEKVYASERDLVIDMTARADALAAKRKNAKSIEEKIRLARAERGLRGIVLFYNTINGTDKKGHRYKSNGIEYR